MTAQRPPRASRMMLITGATGFIGARLATLAQEAGYHVRTLTRSNWTGLPDVPLPDRFFGSLPAGIPWLALEGVGVIVHCAAYFENDAQTAHTVNVTGTVRLAEIAKEAGVEDFIFLSSQSARPEAPSAYGRTKYAAECALLALAGPRMIILRPGLVTGPGSRGLFQRMCSLVTHLPILPLPDGGNAIVQPIHVDDLAAAILSCAALGAQLAPAVLRLGLPGGVSLRHFLQAIAVERCGRKKPSIDVPLWPLEMVLRVTERLRLSLPVHRGNVEALRCVNKMETATDLARLGVCLRPLDAMIRYEPAAPKARCMPRAA